MSTQQFIHKMSNSCTDKECYGKGILVSEGDSDSSDSEPNDSTSLLPLICSGENKPLSVDKVSELLQFASFPERTISVPQIQPKGGEVYLYVPESSTCTSKLKLESLFL